MKLGNIRVVRVCFSFSFFFFIVPKYYEQRNENESRKQLLGVFDKIQELILVEFSLLLENWNYDKKVSTFRPVFFCLFFSNIFESFFIFFLHYPRAYMCNIYIYLFI